MKRFDLITVAEILGGLLGAWVVLLLVVFPLYDLLAALV